MIILTKNTMAMTNVLYGREIVAGGLEPLDFTVVRFFLERMVRYYLWKFISIMIS